MIFILNLEISLRIESRNLAEKKKQVYTEQFLSSHFSSGANYQNNSRGKTPTQVPQKKFEPTPNSNKVCNE